MISMTTISEPITMSTTEIMGLPQFDPHRIPTRAHVLEMTGQTVFEGVNPPTGLTVHHPECPELIHYQNLGVPFTEITVTADWTPYAGGDAPAWEGINGWICKCLDVSSGRTIPVRGEQGDNVDAPERRESTGESTGSSSPSGATEAQERFIRSLMDEKDPDLTELSIQIDLSGNHRLRTTDRDEFIRSIPSPRVASHVIDALKNLPREGQTTEAPDRTNRFAGSCVECGGHVEAEQGSLTKGSSGWEVRHHPTCPESGTPVTPDSTVSTPPVEETPLEAGRIYQHPDGRVVQVQESKAGRLYGKVWDGSGWEYQSGALFGVTGDHLISAEQAAEFGHLTGRCVFCSRTIKTDESLAVGYGPKCAADHGLPWGAK